MLYVSIGASALVLLFANLCAARRSGGKVCWLSGIAFVLSLGCVVPALMLNFLLLMIVAFICLCTRAHYRIFLALSLAVTILSYGIVSFWAISEIRKQDDLRAQFPLESMSDRLAYEGHSKKRGADSKSEKTKEPETSLRLAAEFGPTTFRAHYLGKLHEGFVKKFVDSQGFGVSRRLFMNPTKEQLEIPAIEPIPFPLVNEDDFSAESLAAENGKSVAFDPDKGDGGKLKVFRELHENSFVDFVNVEGFGYIVDREHVAGFQAHQFRQMPEVEGQEPGRWQINRLDLVSLLKHEEPMVYLSNHLPRMDELRHAKVRPLDAFEKAALTALERGEDLKVSSSADRIRMLGSIRAVSQCVRCHDAERGDLLGAFSYTLQHVARAR